jgi:hypothetical protein
MLWDAAMIWSRDAGGFQLARCAAIALQEVVFGHSHFGSTD